MGTVPVPYTWSDEEIPDFRAMESRLATLLGFVQNPPMVRLRRTTAFSIPNATNTPIPWTYVEVETENMWDAVLPTRIKPSTPGWYVGTYGGSWQSSTTGVRQADILKNGSGTITTMRVKAEGFTTGPTVIRGNTFIEQFNGTTDYIEAYLYQNAGTALNVDVSTIETQPDVVLRFLAPL